MKRLVSAFVTSLAVIIATAPGRTQAPVPVTHLVIVVDGLRPDYVTADVMPRLFRLG